LIRDQLILQKSGIGGTWSCCCRGGIVGYCIDKLTCVSIIRTVIKAALEEFANVLDDGEQKQRIERYLQNI
jgi:hypothetical protein